MKVVLVVCNIALIGRKRGRLRLRWESTYREGLASIAGVLRHAGIDVQRLKVEQDYPDDDFITLFRDNFADADVVGFTTNTVDFPETVRLSRLLKREFPDMVTVCGGVHPTMSPDETLAGAPDLDMICRGEGELALKELCEQLAAGREPSGILGLWIRKGDAIEKNEIRPLIANLDDLPPPYRDLPTVGSYDLNHVKDLDFFMGTRGCPYKCTYCCNDGIRALFPNRGDYYRYKSVDAVIGELTHYLDDHPKTRFISFYDDVLMADKKWFAEFAEDYAQKVNRACFLTGRWELLTEQTVPLVKKLNCLFLLIGVEVGNEKLRRKTLKRNQSDAMMLQRAELLRRHKVRYGLFTMVGLPDETLENALETVKLAAKLRGNQIIAHHTIFYPFQGTPLYERCDDEGVISDRRVGSYFEDTRLDMNQFSRHEIVAAHRRFRWYRFAYWLTYRLPRRLAQWLEERLDRAWLTPRARPIEG